MLLSELLSGIELSSISTGLLPGNIPIEGILTDTRNHPGGMERQLYVCIRGTKADGHQFAEKAEEMGAAAILCERDTGCRRQILVPDSRKAYALLCANFFGGQYGKMELVAVTGTNGKTSVATTVKRLLTYAGVNTGLISTIQAEYGEQKVELSRTTPDPWELHRLLAGMQESGITAAAMEASSHALDQDRLYGLRFAVGIFTNLTQDHLDYHKDMEEYYQAKRKLFELSEFGVVNVDDEYGRRLASELTIPFVSCSIQNPEADYYAEKIECGETGVRFLLCHDHVKSRVEFGIPGLYSVHNALEAIAACVRLGVSLDTVIAGMKQMGVIRGRNELIETGRPFRVICDYAHTPDGLENILKSTRQYAAGRIVAVFGCGGDRDKGKRPKMGAVAAMYADFLVITSDNPRTENPGAIISGILKGIPPGTRYIVIPERRDAIRYALTTARKGDTIILAGKGHEQYQVLGDKTLYFDERRLVEGILRTMD